MSKNLENWFRVEVSDIQGQVVAIETEMLCGRDIGENEEKAIKSAIENLSSFIGYSRALPDEDWQPIESAPKDGTYILLGNECGAWIGRYQPVYQSGYAPSNPWQSMMLNHEHMGTLWNLTPSNWKPLLSPLPKPPETRG